MTTFGAGLRVGSYPRLLQKQRYPRITSFWARSMGQHCVALLKLITTVAVVLIIHNQRIAAAAMAETTNNSDSTTTTSHAAAAAAAAVEQPIILCPFFRTLKPNESNSGAFLWDVVVHGKVGVGLAQSLVFGAVVVQQGFWPALWGGVLDLRRLDELPGISHLDLYNSQFAGVSERLLAIAAAADADGYITLQDLVEIKKWVAEVTSVEEINLFSRGETIFVFLGAGGSLKNNRVLATDVLRFLQSVWEIKDIGNVNAVNLAKGLLQAGF
jgi:hypothetical protein